jgi:hypothetical protein
MREIKTHHDGLGLTELCRVFAAGKPHPVNGANHRYKLQRDLTAREIYLECDSSRAKSVGFIQFQCGPRDEPDSTPGTLDGAVLAVLIDRLESFQAGSFACPENEIVLEHLRSAAVALVFRARDRALRGVLGKNEK